MVAPSVLYNFEKEVLTIGKNNGVLYKMVNEKSRSDSSIEL